MCLAACSSTPARVATAEVQAPQYRPSAAAIAGTEKIIAKSEVAVSAAPTARSAQILLEDARKALAAGDTVSARRLARSAAQEAQFVVNNANVQQAKRTLSEVKSYTNLNAQQYVRLRAAENALVNNEGVPATQLLTRLNTQLEASSARYAARNKRANPNPSLIGYQQIANNPFQWPSLIRASYALIQNPSAVLPTLDKSVEMPASDTRTDADPSSEAAS